MHSIHLALPKTFPGLNQTTIRPLISSNFSTAKLLEKLMMIGSDSISASYRWKHETWL